MCPKLSTNHTYAKHTAKSNATPATSCANGRRSLQTLWRRDIAYTPHDSETENGRAPVAIFTEMSGNASSSASVAPVRKT